MEKLKIKIGTAPEFPIYGDQWYDTEQKTLHVFDGKGWRAINCPPELPDYSEQKNHPIKLLAVNIFCATCITSTALVTVISLYWIMQFILFQPMTSAVVFCIIIFCFSLAYLYESDKKNRVP